MSADGPPVENFPELDADVGPDIVQEDPKIGQINEIGNMGTGGAEKKWPGWPGESVFRILVPSPKVGGIIGRKGEYIKKTCEESRARIKILDGPQGAPERAVLCRLLRLQIFLQCVPKMKNKGPSCWDQVLDSVFAPVLSGKFGT